MRMAQNKVNMQITQKLEKIMARKNFDYRITRKTQTKNANEEKNNEILIFQKKKKSKIGRKQKMHEKIYLK